jgi:D-alanyl-lipoteichoic acid acyltransferase DltB (MBOAT superfamily)
MGRRTGRRGTLVAALSGLVALVAGFKLAPLMASVLNGSIWVPIGISYYTFKLISYVVDVYWERVAAEEDFLSFAAYVAFFPQIVAGPIQRADTFLPQVHNAATWSNVVGGFQRVLLGFFKKFLVADNLGLLVNFVYTNMSDPGTPWVLGLYVFPLQLYADFSGLSDIAIGAASMMGIRSPENFYAPFAATNPSEFWRRWHITLGTLLMDYVYTPTRVLFRNFGNAGLVASLFATMMLVGLWHGFRLTFVIFGSVHGAYLAADALTSRVRRRYYNAHPLAGWLSDWFGPVVTFHLVAFSFVFFRAERVGDAFHLLGNLSWRIGSLPGEFAKLVVAEEPMILVGLCCYPLVELADYARRCASSGEVLKAMPTWGRWTVYYVTTVAAAVLVLVLLGTQSPRNTFVYAMF